MASFDPEQLERQLKEQMQMLQAFIHLSGVDASVVVAVHAFENPFCNRLRTVVPHREVLPLEPKWHDAGAVSVLLDALDAQDYDVHFHSGNNDS